MTMFFYFGRDVDGKTVEGQIERSNQHEVANYLISKQISPIKIDQFVQKKTTKNILSHPLFLSKKVSDEQLIMFCRQMYTINKAGVPLIQGLKSLSISMESGELKAILADIIHHLESGVSLAQAMSNHPHAFNNLFVGMVKIGESTGTLDKIFYQLGEYINRDVETRKAIKSALRYPSFVLGAMVIALFVVNLLVIPAFADMFSRFNAQLPLPTRILLGMSYAFVHYWWLIIAITLFAVIGIRFWMKTDEGGFLWDKYRLRLIIAGPLINKASISRYIRSLSLMISSGLPINRAVALCADIIDNKYFEYKINKIKSGIDRGDSIYRTHAKSKLFSPLVLQMIDIGESSGKVDVLLEEVAASYEREVDYDLKSLSSKIEPLLILIMAVFVSVLAMGIFLPMWKCSQFSNKKTISIPYLSNFYMASFCRPTIINNEMITYVVKLF